jgi:hypothetical protein
MNITITISMIKRLGSLNTTIYFDIIKKDKQLPNLLIILITKPHNKDVQIKHNNHHIDLQKKKKPTQHSLGYKIFKK